ncbi:EamA family transporter [Aeromicrobium chenweiae]|uniref:EamA domain-containing protein n=1 Tax=Aeromicrobium chenweiae TaxID=2079793 RepID=A0A2S0WP25_9ACTN|nr:EamA family transporter [Aeromicrobium chenweiae]AWB93061.1 hypothetical protein C3E78_13065 [Aeromicrobium chenweiae]TGN34050.1 hypothetical protein E4L97_03100 [Aeromicrobium chenweiae]
MTTTALALVLSAAVAHAAWNIVAHGVSHVGLPFLWWGALSSTVVWIGLVPVTGGTGGGWLHLLVAAAVSGVLHTFYMVVLQRGYARGQVSTVYATARATGPVVTCLLAVLLFQERPGVLAVVGVLVVIGGVAIIALVDANQSVGALLRDPAILYGLLTGLSIAAYSLWDAHAVQEWKVSPVAFMVGCTAAELVLYAPALRGRGEQLRAAGRQHVGRIVAFGVLSPLAYILVLLAVQRAPLSLVAPLREISVVLVSLYGVAVLREARPVAKVVASVVVVAGIALLAS